MRRSCVWFLVDNRNRTASFYWTNVLAEEGKSFHDMLVFVFMFCWLVWFLTSQGQLKAIRQLNPKDCRICQNHLSSLKRHKMLQNKISSLSGLCFCQKCPMTTALWEAATSSDHKEPWSLLIKRKWFSIQSNQISPAHLRRVGFRCSWKFGVDFSFSYYKSSLWAWILMLFFQAQQNPLSGYTWQLHSWDSCKFACPFLSWTLGFFQGPRRIVSVESSFP